MTYDEVKSLTRVRTLEEDQLIEQVKAELQGPDSDATPASASASAQLVEIAQRGIVLAAPFRAAPFYRSELEEQYVCRCTHPPTPAEPRVCRSPVPDAAQVKQVPCGRLLVQDGRMTLAVGSIPTVQLTAIPSHHPILPPTPPPRHCPCRSFLIPRVPPRPYISFVMEGTPVSPLPPFLPCSSEVFLSSSPSPPPPPPSYSISDLSIADLPPPPPLTLWKEMASPYYMCCYDPPSPEVKSEYDPKLPPGFFSTPDIFPSSPPPPPVPAPPRPSPPPPPTPPARLLNEASPTPHDATNLNEALDLHPESAVESEGCEDHSIENCSTSSLASSSTLTASYFQTPDSALSPLPPHTLRVSSLSTDDITLSSQCSVDDSITPSSDVSMTPNFICASQEYTLESNTSEFVSHASVLMDTLKNDSLTTDPSLLSLLIASKLDQQECQTQTTGQYKRMESIKSEDGMSIPSEVSGTTNDTAGPALMASPLSTDIPSLPSLPTDPDSVSSGLGSLTTDTLSLSSEWDSQLEDASTIKTETSGFSTSDTAYTTGESEAGSLACTTSCTITPMPSDYLTPLFPSPALTPVASPLPSSPLPYWCKSESPLNSGSNTPRAITSLESLQTHDGEISLSSGVSISQAASLENSSSSCHSSIPPTQGYSSFDLDICASQPPSSSVTDQYVNHIKEIAKKTSGNKYVLSCSNHFSLDINPNSQRTTYEKTSQSHEITHSTASLENGQLPEKITEKQMSDVYGKEEIKVCSNDGSENRELNDELDGKDRSVQKVCKEEENHNGVRDVMECRENGDNNVVKDMNGNVSYSGLEELEDAQLENGDVNVSKPDIPENTEAQIMKASLAGSIQPAAEVHERRAVGQDDISSEILKVVSPHSPVLPSSLTHSPAHCTITPTFRDISSGKALHLPTHSEATLVNDTARNTVSPCSGTPSTFTHCSPRLPKPEPCRATQESSASMEAMELLNAVVINLENLSADLPASSTSRSSDSSLPQAAPTTVLSTADQPGTHVPETSKMSPFGLPQNRNPVKLKVEACDLSMTSPLIPSSLPHLTPISPAFSPHICPSEATVLKHACVDAYCSGPSTCVSPACPSLIVNTVNPALSVSPTSWNKPHSDSDPLPSGSSDDHTNTTLQVEDSTESASKKEVLLCSHWTGFQDSFPVGNETPFPSLSSSPKPGSLLDGQPSPPPAPRSKTPPTPPPRSCHNTPRSSLAPPLPPVRQYILVPINHPFGTPQLASLPPAPPRSISVHRSSPPPPPRPTAPHLPPPVQEWNKGPPLPPPPVSSSFPPPQPALTPVPEESSNPQSPVFSRSSQSSSPVSEGVISQTLLLPDSSATSNQLPSESLSLPYCSIEDAPPAFPPPPEDEQEEDLPPLPPPPKSEDEATPPLPLPPPPDPNVLFNLPFLPSLTQGKDELSNPLCSCQEPAFPAICVTASLTNLSSAPSSDPDQRPPAVDDVAIPPPPEIPYITASPKSPMPNSQAVDAATTPSLPSIPPPPHVPPSSPPMPPGASGPNTEKAANIPLITTSTYGKMVVVRSDLPLPTPEEEVRVAFTAAKDWGFLAKSEDTLSVYTQLRPIIQQGPQCGLVALSMASQVFPQTMEVEELLAAGRAQGATQHGEMFSTAALAQLAERTVPGLHAEVRRDVLSSPATLLQLLLQGDLVLVPYDAERNHQPGQKGGHKAHWGVVCGCLVQSCALTLPTGAAKLDSHVDYLWHLRPRSRAGRSRSVTPCPPTLPGSPKIGQRGLKTPDRTHGCEGNASSVSCSRVNTPMLSDLRHDSDLRVVALWRQGKSRKVVASPLDQLCESNDQLVSYPLPATPLEAEYVVGSIEEGLAGQVVVLHKTKAALSDLVGLLQEK